MTDSKQDTHNGTGMSDRAKAIGQFELQLNGILGVFNVHGPRISIPEVKKAITEHALQLHERLNGKDVPI